jgi:predicted RNA-binding Zn-ribbon protein involved in translation (DUF1610 family)
MTLASCQDDVVFLLYQPEERTIMSKKIALTVKCPECQASLMDSSFRINNKDSIKLHIRVKGDEKGTIWLSSIYGDFNYTCDLQIPEEEVANFYCPHCSKLLNRSNVVCDICGATIVSFNCVVGGRVNICSRNGCRNHFVVFEDLDTAIRKYYDEYGYA